MNEGYKDKPKHSDETPFLRELKDAGLNSTYRKVLDIKVLEGLPNKLIRQWPIYEESIKTSDHLKNFKRRMGVFRELEEKHGVAIPKMDLAVGKNQEGGRAMFTVIDKIYGKAALYLSSLSEEAVRKFDEFFAALAKHYIQAYEKGGDYWDDFNLKQIVYGHKAGEEEDRVYIVDTDPYICFYNKKESSLGEVPLRELFELLDQVKFMEVYSQLPAKKFSLFRRTVDELLIKALKDEESPDIVNYIHKIRSSFNT